MAIFLHIHGGKTVSHAHLDAAVVVGIGVSEARL